MRSGLHRIAAPALAAVLLAAGAACPTEYEIVRAPATDTKESVLQDWLDEDDYLDPGPLDDAIGIVAPLPPDAQAARAADLFSIRHVNVGTLTPATLRPISPRDAFASAGVYAGVFSTSAAGVRVYYLDRLGEPRHLLFESADARGTISASPVDLKVVMTAFRVPFIRGARVLVFEIDDTGDVTRIHLELDLGPDPPQRRRDRNRITVR